MLLPHIDCYRCGGKDCMTVYPDGLHVCDQCGRSWRKPAPAKPVRVEYAKPAVCAICGQELYISFYTGKTECGCRPKGA